MLGYSFNKNENDIVDVIQRPDDFERNKNYIRKK